MLNPVSLSIMTSKLRLVTHFPLSSVGKPLLACKTSDGEREPDDLRGSHTFPCIFGYENLMFYPEIFLVFFCFVLLF